MKCNLDRISKDNREDIMANTYDGGLFGFRKEEARDDKIERLAREAERNALIVRMKKCKTLRDFRELLSKLENGVSKG